MNFADLDAASLIASLLIAATPIMIAAIGELVAEKSGVLNLGVEGMMIIGAVCGFAIAVESGSPAIGFVAAAFAGAVLAALFATLTQLLLSNQVATGLALTLFGLGLAALIGHSYNGIKPPSTPKLDLGADVPFLGTAFLNHDPVIYLSILLVALVWYFLNYTRLGLILRATGVNHDAAYALGYRVIAIRFGALMFGGACAGVGGAYLSLVRVPQWTEGMTAGAGWIALALVVFGAWKPFRVLLGAYLFGGISVLQLNLQAAGINPLFVIGAGLVLTGLIIALSRLMSKTEAYLMQIVFTVLGFLCLAVAFFVPGFTLGAAYLSMAPYLVTILVLVLMSNSGTRAALDAPAALGKQFHASS